MDAVGPDRDIDLLAAAILELQRHPLRVVLQALEPAAELDQLGRQRVGQRGQHVGPVDRHLRRAVLLLGDIAHAQARGLQPGVPVAADPEGRLRAVPAHRRAHAVAQAVECAHRVRRQVDVRADAGEPAGLLVDADTVAGAAQRDGRSQTADAAADDADMQCTHGINLLVMKTAGVRRRR